MSLSSLGLLLGEVYTYIPPQLELLNLKSDSKTLIISNSYLDDSQYKTLKNMLLVVNENIAATTVMSGEVSDDAVYQYTLELLQLHNYEKIFLSSQSKYLVEDSYLSSSIYWIPHPEVIAKNPHLKRKTYNFLLELTKKVSFNAS